MKWGLEDQTQIAIMDWIETYVPQAFAFHIANERYCSPQMGMKLKRLGTKRGVPDIAVMLPGGRQIYIEVKAPKGVQSPPQKMFEKTACRLGFVFFVARSLDDCRNRFWEIGVPTREVAAA